MENLLNKRLDFIKVRYKIHTLPHIIYPYRSTYISLGENNVEVFIESITGNSVDDTDIKNLVINSKVPLGGTTGQVLTKTGNNDFDIDWVNSQGGTGSIDSITGNIVDNTDPANPIINASQVGISNNYNDLDNKPSLNFIESVTGTAVDLTDPINPIINNPTTPNLQQVTDQGQSTTNSISHADGVNPQDSATLGQLDTAIGSINQSLPDGLLSGGIVVWKETGYDYEVSNAELRENGVVDVVNGIDFTLATADPTLPRKDTIVVSLEFGFEVLQGTPAVDPVEPQAIPPRIRLTAIDVAAGSTAPIVINTVVAYKENLEYPITHSGFGTSNADNLENPFEGTKAIKVSPVQNNSTTIATAPADINVADVSSISFRLALIQTFSNGHNIAVEFRDLADNPVSNQVVLSITKNTTLYQFIAFALDSFTFTSPTFRKIAIIFKRTGNQAQRGGYYIDNWILQGGIETPPIQPELLTSDELAAIRNSNNPSGANVFATINDLPVIPTDFVESVTGTGVDNTDPKNPIVNIPVVPNTIIESVTGGLVDNTDPSNPVVNGVASVTGDGVNNTNPTNPIISFPDLFPDFAPATGNLSFAPLDGKPRKYGFGASALTGNIVFTTVGARETTMIKALWNDGTLPTVSVLEGSVTLIKDSGDFVESVDNYIESVCYKNDAGDVILIRYSINQA